MAILSHPAFGPRTALMYITIGSLMDVWTAVWYFAFLRDAPHPMSNVTWFWLIGLFLTGITLIVLGLALGPIGQAARRAELPPSEVARQEAVIQQTAAAHAVPPAALAGTAPPAVMPAPPVSMAPPAAPVMTR